MNNDKKILDLIKKYKFVLVGVAAFFMLLIVGLVAYLFYNSNDNKWERANNETNAEKAADIYSSLTDEDDYRFNDAQTKAGRAYLEFYQKTGDDKYRKKAIKCVKRLEEFCYSKEAQAFVGSMKMYGTLSPEIPEDRVWGAKLIVGSPLSNKSDRITASEILYKAKLYEELSENATPETNQWLGLCYFYGKGRKAEFNKAYAHLLKSPDNPEYAFEKGELILLHYYRLDKDEYFITSLLEKALPHYTLALEGPNKEMAQKRIDFINSMIEKRNKLPKREKFSFMPEGMHWTDYGDDWYEYYMGEHQSGPAPHDKLFTGCDYIKDHVYIGQFRKVDNGVHYYMEPVHAYDISFDDYYRLGTGYHCTKYDKNE